MRSMIPSKLTIQCQQKNKAGNILVNFFIIHNSIKGQKKILDYSLLSDLTVLNHGEGVCVDPGKRDATLGVGGPGPPGGDSEHQLIPDSGGGKT
jgi:hypothetical protein